jgi:transcriptional regulator with XRE-family HTH domain
LTSFPETLALTEQGRKRVLNVEDWAEIRRLRRSEGMSISQISRVVGLARNTVKTALNSESPPRYRREPAGSLVDGFEPRIRELLQAYPTMPATVIEGKGRLAVLDPDTQRSSRRTETGVSATGPGLAYELRSGRDCAV